MQITVLKVNVTQPAGKNYKICELGYKTEEGKVKGMRIFSFGTHEEVFKVASVATKGDILEAQFRQNDKGFWEFGKLEATGKQAAPGTTDTTENGFRGRTQGGGRDFETAEERAQKQIYIVRQSSLTTALEVLRHNTPKNAVTVDDVIGMARVFEAYVFEKPKQQTPTVE